MRRARKEATKVWHNPEITGLSARGNTAPKPTHTAEDRRAQKQHRAALEALFAPKREAPASEPSKPAAQPMKMIVITPAPPGDPRGPERQRLLSRFMIAEGRPAVSKAADDFWRAGFTFPADQDIHLKLLDHGDEGRVREAINALEGILAGELPKRRAVLESRLRRIEEYAEEEPTRASADRLRKLVTGRPGPISDRGV